MQRAFAIKGVESALRIVSDGARPSNTVRRGKYADRKAYLCPMSFCWTQSAVVSGFEVLEWMRNHRTSPIPGRDVFIFHRKTTRERQPLSERNGFLTKPVRAWTSAPLWTTQKQMALNNRPGRQLAPSFFIEAAWVQETSFSEKSASISG